MLMPYAERALWDLSLTPPRLSCISQYRWPVEILR